MANVPTVSWDENAPAGNEVVSNGDNRIRELKTQVREVVDVEHQYDSSGQSTENGIHTKGSARAYYQAANPTLRPDGSTSLDTSDDGRLFVDSDDDTVLVWNGSSFDDVTVADIVDRTPGTVDASKPIVVGSSKDLDTLTVAALTGTVLTAPTTTIATSLTLSGQTASRMLVTDGSKGVVTNSVTSTEAGHLSGVTSAIQTQLDARVQGVVSNLKVSTGKEDNIGAGASAVASFGVTFLTAPAVVLTLATESGGAGDPLYPITTTVTTTSVTIKNRFTSSIADVYWFAIGAV